MTTFLLLMTLVRFYEWISIVPNDYSLHMYLLFTVLIHQGRIGIPEGNTHIPHIIKIYGKQFTPTYYNCLKFFESLANF